MSGALLTRAFAVTANSYNPETRTFIAVLSTGADVQRRDANGLYRERLDLPGVDAAALAGMGIRLLDGHSQASTRDVLGKLLRAWREGDNIVGEFQLSSAPDVESVRVKVAAGEITDVSIGYGAATRREFRENGRRIVAVVPAIREVSLVPIGADGGAKIRKEDSSPMPIETTEDTGAAAPVNDNAIETRAQIRAIARAANQSAEWADTLIDSGADITAARAAAFEAITTRPSPVIRTHAPANDDPSVILQRRADAMFARVNGTAPDDAARQYFNDGLADHARAFLTMSGASVNGMDREQILRAAMHTTGDFPELLTGVGNRTLMPAYQAAQSPLKMLARQALMTDFRTATRLRLGEIGTLPAVTESGEITSTTRGEVAESYALKTYGSMFALARMAIINDDLGAFRDWGIAAGRAAAQTEGDLLWTLASQSSGAGPLMGEDGVRMFHASHGNLASTGAPLNEDGAVLSDGRKALRNMKGTDGVTPIAVTPKYLLVGPEQETVAEKLLTATAAPSAGDVNPFAGKLTLLVEPRITDDAWYLFADPAQLAVLEYAYLSSAQGPQMASREGWDVLGMEFRVVLDFGCGAVDYRGAYRNAGA